MKTKNKGNFIYGLSYFLDKGHAYNKHIQLAVILLQTGFAGLPCLFMVDGSTASLINLLFQTEVMKNCLKKQELTYHTSYHGQIIKWQLVNLFCRLESKDKNIGEKFLLGLCGDYYYSGRSIALVSKSQGSH
jgi:hypothetical protein